LGIRAHAIEMLSCRAEKAKARSDMNCCGL
jgi:hypothetical protein